MGVRTKLRLMLNCGTARVKTQGRVCSLCEMGINEWSGRVSSDSGVGTGAKTKANGGHQAFKCAKLHAPRANYTRKALGRHLSTLCDGNLSKSLAFGGVKDALDKWVCFVVCFHDEPLIIDFNVQQ
jgi:hypothetical protein